MTLENNAPKQVSVGGRLNDWYTQPLGRLLADAEAEILEGILPNLFGYHLLQVGFVEHSPLSVSRVLHRSVMAVGGEGDPTRVSVAGLPEQLPITSGSLDALVLYHTLEFATDPHEVLREADRTLVPEGNIVVLGFNPRSLWGVRRLLRRHNTNVPWCGRFLSIPRIKDWLRLLGFDIVSCRPLFFRPPLQRQGLLRRLHLLETLGRRGWPMPGGSYVLVARKKTLALTPLKPRWRPRRSLVSGLAGPASRSLCDNQCDRNRH